MKYSEFEERKNEIKENILDFLYQRREQCISGNILKEKFNLKTIQLQELIHILRVQEKSIICKGNRGYSYTTNKDDILTYILQLNNRIKNIENALKGLKTSFNTTEIIVE